MFFDIAKRGNAPASRIAKVVVISVIAIKDNIPRTFRIRGPLQKMVYDSTEVYEQRGRRLNFVLFAHNKD